MTALDRRDSRFFSLLLFGAVLTLATTPLFAQHRHSATLQVTP